MMLATSDDDKVFLEALFGCSRNWHKSVTKAIALAKERYDVDLYAILTDNAYNMQCMRADCESWNLLCSICNSHTANLLAGDILKVTKYSNIMSKVMTVQKDFKKTGLENRLLKTGGRKLVAENWSCLALHVGLVSGMQPSHF